MQIKTYIQKIILTVALAGILLGCGGGGTEEGADQNQSSGDQGNSKGGGNAAVNPTVKQLPDPKREKPTNVADMKKLLGVPLSSAEKKHLGRWKNLEDEAADYVGWLINRADHTYTFLSISPEVDEDGDKVPGKMERFVIHGIWAIHEGTLYLADMVYVEGGKAEAINESEQEIWTFKITKLGVNEVVYESEDDEGKFTMRDKRVDKFNEPEMLPYNARGALKGFDLLKAYKEAKKSP